MRLVVRDVPRHVARELDHKALREFKRRALHFHLDTRRPEVTARRRTAARRAGGRRSPTLVREQLQQRVLDADIDREALVALGLRYLDEAERCASAPTHRGRRRPAGATDDA